MNSELQAVVENIEREHNLDRETIIRAIEEGLLVAARKSMHGAATVRVQIDRKTLAIRMYAAKTVIASGVPGPDQIRLADAQKIKPDAQPGDTIEVEVPASQLGRIAAQSARQSILQEIRKGVRSRVYELYKNAVGTIVSGTVSGFDRRDVLVKIDDAEAVLPASERPSSEQYQLNDRIQALVLSVDPTGHPMITLSRSSPDFVRRLFEREVAEIGDGTVEIRAIARDPGFRTKIAVASRDDKVDPVGACVGLRGMRVQNITRELNGERVDVVRWHPDPRQFVTNALHPAKLERVRLDEATRTAYVSVPQDQQALAIGREGKNVRLAMKLTGWQIKIEREEAVPFDEKVAAAVKELAAIEGIGREKAEALVRAGFLDLESILAAEPSDLLTVEGLDATSAELVRKAAAAEHERRHGTISS